MPIFGYVVCIPIAKLLSIAWHRYEAGMTRESFAPRYLGTEFVAPSQPLFLTTILGLEV